MKKLIDIRRTLLRFYSKFDTYFTAALKFAVAFFVLYRICGSMGYMGAMGQAPLLLIVAAFCSFLSPNVLVLTGAVYLEGQFLGHSPEATIVGGIVLILLLLLYFSFISGQAYVVILTALGISLQVPLLVPLLSGLLAGPGALAGIIFGTGIYYITHFLIQGPQTQTALGEALFRNVMEDLQALLLQEELVLMAVTLAAVCLVVYVIRRLPVRYGWSIAIVSGLAVYGGLYSLGTWLLQGQISVPNLVVNLILGGMVGSLVQLFAFGVDYKKVQYLQFEDDDYYYYVKAVSKFDQPEEDEDYYLD